jgi:hypothetical protein
MKYWQFFLYLFLPLFSTAQIAGKVATQNNNPLPSASITLHKKNIPSIIAFAISDKDGKFIIHYTANTNDTLELNVALLGYSKQTVFFLPTEKKDFQFVLTPEAINLPEVKVKNPPVWQRKDTINYNTSEFKQAQDRVIGDIIARLPGMEVTPGGQIKYQGKPINKYYIEGLDLLEDKYGLANNNIPADAVDKVQVLENHQPIRVLDSVSFSDRAALNIKLKNNAKLKLLGRARLGMGAAPLLSEDDLSLMLFKKKIQFINTYKYNNTGVDNTRELTSQNFADYINALQNGAAKNDLVSLVQPQAPPINSKRYLFNNAHTASINQLVPLNKIYQLRINAAYINDFQQQESHTSSRFFLPNDSVLITENNNYKSFLNRIDADATVMANSPNYFLKNHTRFQAWLPFAKSNITGNTLLAQQINNPFHNISNDFRLIKTNKKRITEWSSFIGYVTMPQQLQIQPGLYSNLLNNNSPYEAMQQQASLKNFFTDNYLSIRKRKGRWGLAYKVGANLQLQLLNTNLQIKQNGLLKNVADTFQNNLHWNRFRVNTEGNFTYETERIRLALNLPLQWIYLSANDELLAYTEKRNALLPSPSASIMWQLSPKWSLSSAASYNQSLGDINSITNGYILKNYRSITNNNIPLPENASGNINVNITFRNPLKILFVSGGVNVSRTKSNLFYSQSFSGSLETLLATVRNNFANNLGFSGRISKYITNWKTSINLSTNYNLGKRQQLQNNTVVNLHNTSFMFSGGFTTKISQKINTEYNGTYQNYKTKSQLSKTATSFKTFTQIFAINYNVSEALFIKLAGENYSINSTNSRQQYLFGDASVRLKPKKSKIDYELLLNNIFNTTEFTGLQLADNIAIISNYIIRPRQVLFKVSFSLQ